MPQLDLEVRMKNEVEKAIERWDGCTQGWAHINNVPGTRWWDRRKWRKQALVDLDTLVRFLQTDGGRKLVRDAGSRH